MGAKSDRNVRHADFLKERIGSVQDNEGVIGGV